MDDLRIIGIADVTAMVLAPPDVALEVARGVAGEMPGGCPQIVVLDCDWMDEYKALASIERYLAPDSRERPPSGIVLFREVHALSRACQQRLAALVGTRSREQFSVRIMASTSLAFGDEVPCDLFESELFYILNTVTVTRDVLLGRVVRAWPRVVSVGH